MSRPKKPSGFGAGALDSFVVIVSVTHANGKSAASNKTRIGNLGGFIASLPVG
jgi:hypothetical protein